GGREAAAGRWLRRGRERRPGDGMLHHALGRSLIRQQQRDAALEHLRRAWELQPENPRTGDVLAVALEPSAPQQVLEILRSGMDLHPQDRDLLWAGAIFAIRHGQLKL